MPENQRETTDFSLSAGRIKTALAVAAFIFPLAVSAIGVYVQGQIAEAKITMQIAGIRESAARHELEKEREISRLSATSEDHGQRIIRLETTLGSIQASVDEMKTDIKTLLRKGGR